MVTRNYPFDESLKRDIPKVLSPVIVMRFIRIISRMLDISHPQVEVLMLLAGNHGSLSFSEIRTQMSHLGRAVIINLLNSLLKDNLITKNGTKYTICSVAVSVIKSVDRSQLNPV